MPSRAQTAFALAALLLAAGAAAQETVLLAPHFETGRGAYVEQTSRTLRKFNREGAQPLEARSSLTIGMQLQILSADGAAANKRWTVERIVLADETPGQALRFDTDAAPAGTPGAGPEAAARALLGKSVEMRVARGKCEPNREQVAALRTAAAAVAGQSPGSASILDELSPERFRYSWGDARHALYAWREVRPGDTWENTLRQSSPDGTTTIYQYRCKLEAVEKSEGRTVARVSFSGDIRPEGDEEARPNQHGVTMKLDSGRFQGTAVFDVAKHEFTTQDTVAELRATATTPVDSAGKQQTIRFEQKIESRTTIAPSESRAKRGTDKPTP